jgi:signal transduction histidine kinase
MKEPETFFAPTLRTERPELEAEIDFASRNPVMTGLLEAVSGLLAILDENRQVVAVNHSFLAMIGIRDPAEILGLRPGEIVRCVHADKQPAGCGTTEFCATCGAAVAIVTSLATGKPEERLCALSVSRDGKVSDLALLVTSQPLVIEGRRFLLLFLRDVTEEQQRAALERIFYHDFNNILSMLVGASEILVRRDPSTLADAVRQASRRLMQEMTIQRCLAGGNSLRDYRPAFQPCSLPGVAGELKTFFASHPVAADKDLQCSEGWPDLFFDTDTTVLLRILANMIINALEATPRGGTVLVNAGADNSRLTFEVWNQGEIPSETARRIFQRNFSTKDQAGRGLGTYSMKLLGEEVLGGKVWFTTSRDKGTAFFLEHPL